MFVQQATPRTLFIFMLTLDGRVHNDGRGHPIQLALHNVAPMLCDIDIGPATELQRLQQRHVILVVVHSISIGHGLYTDGALRDIVKQPNVQRHFEHNAADIAIEQIGRLEAFPRMQHPVQKRLCFVLHLMVRVGTVQNAFIKLNHRHQIPQIVL